MTKKESPREKGEDLMTARSLERERKRAAYYAGLAGITRESCSAKKYGGKCYVVVDIDHAMLSVTRPNAIKVLGWYYTPEEASKARERMPRARRGHEISDMAVTTYERLLRGEYMQAGRLKACPTMKEQSLYTASKKQKKLAERFAMEAEETSARKANLLVEKSKRFIDKSKKTDLSPSEKQELASMLTAIKKAGIEIPEACDIGKEKCFVVVIMSIKQKHDCLFTPHGNKTKMSNLPKSCLVAKILHKYNRKPEADEDAIKITSALHGQDMEVMAMSKDEFYKLRSQGYTLVG